MKRKINIPLYLIMSVFIVISGLCGYFMGEYINLTNDKFTEIDTGEYVAEANVVVNYSLDFGGAQPSSVSLIINSETIVLPVVSSSYTGTLIVGENEIEQVVKLGNRTSTASSIIEVTPLDEIKNSIIDYNHLGAGRLDYVLEDQEYLHFTEEVTELVSGFEIMNKTVLDIIMN